MAQGAGHLYPQQQFLFRGKPLLAEPARRRQHGRATAAVPLHQRQGVEAIAAGFDRIAQQRLHLALVSRHLFLQGLEVGGADPLGQIRLQGDQQPGGVKHQAEQHDAREAVQQLPGIAGIEHVPDSFLEGVAGGSGEHLHPLRQPFVEVSHGDQAESS